MEVQGRVFNFPTMPALIALVSGLKPLQNNFYSLFDVSIYYTIKIIHIYKKGKVLTSLSFMKYAINFEILFFTNTAEGGWGFGG